ncbi:flavin reductase family protein [Candidatus Woesearchaeota archaeon]|nr:flavin reductase family protein [Candidatus Woesearchaeota archaeon]
MGIYNPRNTIIVTCRDKGFDDAVTLSWHSPASHKPFLYSIFLAGKRKSYKMIKNSSEFCVNFITKEQEKLALFCGTKSGHNADKFREGGIEKEECSDIDCPRIKDCSAYLECKVVDIIEVGDHFMAVGRVVKEVEGNNKKRLFQSNITGNYTFTTTS